MLRAHSGAWFLDGYKDKTSRICSTGRWELRQVTLRPVTGRSERPGKVETTCYRRSVRETHSIVWGVGMAAAGNIS